MRFTRASETVGKSRLSILVLGLVLLATVVGGCARFTRPLSEAVLRNGTVPTGLSFIKQVKLHNGLHTEIRNTVELTTRITRFAFTDIDNDGDTDAAMIVQTEARLPGSTKVPAQPPLANDVSVPRAVALVVMRNDKGAPTPVHNTPILATDAQVTKLRLSPHKRQGTSIAPAQVIVDYQTHNGFQATDIVVNHQVFDIEGTELHSRRTHSTNLSTPDSLVIPNALNRRYGSTVRFGVTGFGANQIYQVRGLINQHLSASVVSPHSTQTLTLQDENGNPVANTTPGRTIEVDLPATKTYFLVVTGSQLPARFDLSTTLPVPVLPPGIPGLHTGEKVLHLTFDDGPSTAWTPAVLSLLQRYGATATFFMIGKHAAAHPELVQQVQDTGNVIANHTYDHQDLRNTTQEEFDNEVMRTQEVLGAYAPQCLRPPYGAKDADTIPRAEALGLRTVLWDIDPRDWSKPGVDNIVNAIVPHVFPDAIILMHDGGDDRSQTVAALERILQQLSTQGWRFTAIC